jgi:hypothetical protein
MEMGIQNLLEKVMKTILKIILIASCSGVVAPPSRAVTVEELSKVTAILSAQVRELQDKLCKLEGSAVSDWRTFTPTINKGASGFKLSGRYRWVGSDVEVLLNIQGQADATIEPGGGMYVNYLPDGVEVDSDRLLGSRGRNGGVAYGSAWANPDAADANGYRTAHFELDKSNPSVGRPILDFKPLRIAASDYPGFSIDAFRHPLAFVTLRIVVPVVKSSSAGPCEGAVRVR